MLVGWWNLDAERGGSGKEESMGYVLMSIVWMRQDEVDGGEEWMD